MREGQFRTALETDGDGRDRKLAQLALVEFEQGTAHFRAVGFQVPGQTVFHTKGDGGREPINMANHARAQWVAGDEGEHGVVIRHHDGALAVLSLKGTQ